MLGLDCAAVVSPGLAAQSFPEFFAQRDKDGLVPLGELKQVWPGVFEYQGLLFFAHPYFRRSLSRFNTLNVPFLSRFSAVSPDLNPRIALDEDMVGLASSFQPRVEFLYWYGPKFNDDLSKIKEGISRHEATEEERLLTGIYRTEFWWYTQKGHRSFEAEEIVNQPSFGVSGTDFGCRFVHSMLEDESKRPIHLDGAIRLYDEDMMIRRLDCNMYEAGRHSRYQKLWRIDGPTPLGLWKELVTHYFRDNYLVGEYLGADRPHDDVRASAFPPASDPCHAFVPYDFHPGDGVHVHVSFHNKTARQPGRSVWTLDSVTIDGETLPFVELGTTELAKLFKRSGEVFSIPKGISHIKFGDMAINLPLIVHAGSDAVVLARSSLARVADLCKGLCAQCSDRLLSFTLAVEYEDREVWFSFAGHLTDICSWVNGCPSPIPLSPEGMGAWLEQVYAQLNERFPGEHRTDSLHELLQTSGVLRFTRRFLHPAEYETRYDEHGQMEVMITVIRDSELQQMMQNGDLQVGGAFIVQEIQCSRCSQSYRDCSCSKVLDRDVTCRILGRPAGAF